VQNLDSRAPSARLFLRLGLGFCLPWSIFDIIAKKAEPAAMIFATGSIALRQWALPPRNAKDFGYLPTQ
jgi:hypothetical protein